ncbi:MAG: hypothetical protein ACRDM0_13920, partial [Thermoleophilaceae bacterium]
MNASADAAPDQLDASWLPSQLLDLEVLRRPVDFALLFIVEALLFGLGVAFLVFGFPLVRQAAG